MGEKCYFIKRPGFLGIAIFALVLLGFAFATGTGNGLSYPIGAFVGGGAVFGFLRPELGRRDGE